ncbi:Uncharacterised protein [Mycobacteroides abscessus subsp. abscessus]|uniref:hypothetical protein n=1 Tax=Mycobacteroides abscessus TaxID=36809 RepID=UPI00092696CC|nr:hypothetical protein [Mycobacteroides abscessus]SIC63047.1 Uncharacterised protein [Mycobacteroides abscessus subsp. abscessus]SIG63858.1 Uncharacterised protein [Mycobacteroides abscessus subsp. abscessus]
MRRALIVGVVSAVMTVAFAVPAHAASSLCDSVTTYTFVPMPPPWTPGSLCEAHEALVDRTPLPANEGVTP